MILGISDEQSIFDVGDNLDVSGQVQRVIDFFGPADLEDSFRRYSDLVIDCIYDAFGFKRSAGKVDDPEHDALMKKAKEYSPINYVDNAFAPTLLLQGTMDPLVPLSQSAVMYEKLMINGVRCQLHVSDGGVHDPNSLGLAIS